MTGRFSGAGSSSAGSCSRSTWSSSKESISAGSKPVRPKSILALARRGLSSENSMASAARSHPLFSASLLWRYTAYALVLVALILLIQQWLQCWVTEIAVTNRRVIYKKGLIRRQTNEMNMDKVESVKIDQSILGRMLDYGSVTILGTAKASRRSVPLVPLPDQSSLETASSPERRTTPRPRDPSDRAVALQRFCCGAR